MTREWQEEDRGEQLLVVLHRIRDSDATAHKELEQLAESGSRLAMHYLGEFQANGKHGFEPDVESGIRWLSLAAEKGSIEAAYELGYVYYREGRISEATEVYQSIAKRGYPPAFFRLGQLGLKDAEGNEEKIAALRYFEEAWESGHLISSGLVLWLRRDLGLDRTPFLLTIPKRAKVALQILFKNWRNPSSDTLRS